MSELHILDEETSGNHHHIRQFDEELFWTVEVVDDRRAIKYLATIGAEPVEARYADSALYHLDTAQLIGYLAEISGYRVKVSKKVKRQYSPEHRAALTERLRKINATKNAILVWFSAQTAAFVWNVGIETAITNIVGFSALLRQKEMRRFVHNLVQ